jgi:hypothetical protein
MLRQTARRYYEIVLFAKEIANKLSSEYNIDKSRWKFSIPETYNEYLEQEYEIRYKDKCDCVDSLYAEIYNDNKLYDDAFALTKYDERDDGKLSYRTIISKQHIIELLYHNQDTSIIKEYIEICLRHEIGHVLYIEKEIKDRGGTEDLNVWLYLENEMFNQEYWTFYNEHENDDDDVFYRETCKKYYSLSPESDANECANVDVDKLIELELKVRIGICE